MGLYPTFESCNVQHHIKLKEQIKAPRKVYCIDNGLALAMAFRAGENRNKQLENLVAVELNRRKHYWDNEMEIYYWKNHQQYEVDFVVKKGREIEQLIQVTYASGKDEINKREMRALLKASDGLRCKNLLVITWDYQGTEEIEGRKIDFIPIWQWLL